MSRLRQAAHALRAVARQFPPSTIALLDDDLEACLALVSEVLATSIRHDEILRVLGQLRTSLIGELNELSGMAKQALEEKAAELVTEDGAGEAAAPVSPSLGPKAERLQGQKLPRTNNRDVNAAISATSGSPWVVAKQGNNHIAFLGPNGEVERLPSTPSTGTTMWRACRVATTDAHSRSIPCRKPSNRPPARSNIRRMVIRNRKWRAPARHTLGRTDVADEQIPTHARDRKSVV